MSALYRNVAFLLLLEQQWQSMDENSRAYFRDFMDDEGRARRRRRIPRVALQDPTESGWQFLLGSNNDQAMITVTGFDNATFAELQVKFLPWFENWTPWGSDGQMRRRNPFGGRGRPRKLTADTCLALALVSNRTKGASFALQSFFGLTGTPVGVWLQFARRALCLVLQRDPVAAIRMPTDAKIQQLKDTCNAQFPFLRDAFCVGDGLKLSIENSGDVVVQNAFYNGWTSDTYVTNLFLFALDGRIIAAVLNSVGSWHDSTLAQSGEEEDPDGNNRTSIYSTIERIYQRTGGKCVLDSAFCAGESDGIIKSAQDAISGETPEEIAVLKDATSLRQAAEWGMRALQGAFPRLKDRIPWDEYDNRFFFLLQIVLLYNYRVERVGLNQIRNTYLPALSVDARNFI